MAWNDNYFGYGSGRSKRQGPSMASLKENNFRNYFAQGPQYTFHSGSRNARMGYAASTKSNIKNLQGKPALSNTYGPQYNGATYLNGNQLANHFNQLGRRFDSQLWLFVQAMGSHSLRFFQDTFGDNVKRFNGGFGATRVWHNLQQSTIEKRKRLGLWRRGTRRNILTATNRLVNSLMMTSQRGVFNDSAIIETSPDAFKGVYPEWFIKGKRGGDRRSKKVKGTHREGEIRNVSRSQLTGRRGICYAGYHNDSLNPLMFRQFMGVSNALMSSKEHELMDRFLFYGLFNAYLGAARNNIIMR